MSKQANKTVIGIFVVGAIALVIAAVLILGSGKFFKQTLKAVCYFEGSVGGLNIGAPVVFRGVKIGSVTDVILRFETDKLIFVIPVYIEIEPDKIVAVGPVPKTLGQNLKTLIDHGLRASLEMQSLVTGQMQVGLNFHPDKPGKFAEFKADSKTPEIPTIPTPMQELAKKIEKLPIEEIFEKLQSAIGGIEKVVNSPEVVATIRNLNLAVMDLKKLIGNVDSHVGQLGPEVKGAVTDVRTLVQRADGKIDPLTASVKETVEGYGKVAKNVDERIDPLAASIEKTLEEVRATLVQAKEALAAAEGALEGDSYLSYEINTTLKELNSGMRSIRSLADYLKRHPDSVIWGK